MSEVMIVTGGSRGIGAATARIAAVRGYDVCVNYRQDAAAAASVVDDIEKAGGRAIAVAGDMSSEKDVVNLFETSDAQLGPLKVLINNAGIVGAQSRVEDYTLERLQQMFAINITGAFLCAREAVRRISTRNGGTGGAIVNVSSAAARLGAPNEYVDYAASKGAMDSMTIGLSKEVAAEGIRVNAVRPGLIYTDIHASGGEPGRVERLKEGVPMQRGGEADEVARVILWLASDESSYTTGSLVECSGGR
ncbi:MAG: SDR family oxidoreductase [Gammaproteobacteria bacterium]|jgi:NAD(P)-dependent dehydrogenase (short-subunit alcohol dehydrogenase family)|nr:SDR family oxidoreductase [Gammaproteobacteria bacterium]MDX2459067.1 SDR family oxidoreductase [Gammaproteobacteria bacterium]